MLVNLTGEWLTLETSEFANHEAPSDIDLTHPGLWKRVGYDESRRFVFELPATLVTGDAAEVEENGALSPGAVLDWALATERGHVNQGWKSPSDDLIKAWMPSGALTVRAGGLVRQGEISTDDGWQLGFPLLPSITSDLPEERRVALDLLSADAQNQLRMIRVGWMNGDGVQALVASVDLTGAPHAPALFLAGLEGLSHAITWLAETANLLADVNVALRSLEMLPAANQVRKEFA
jgi:hypothetical protein